MHDSGLRDRESTAGPKPDEAWAGGPQPSGTLRVAR